MTVSSDSCAASPLADLRQRALARPRRIIFPEQDDPRVMQAARTLAEQGLAVPVFLRKPEPEIAGSDSLSAAVDADQLIARAVDAYLDKNRKKQLSPEQAEAALENPLLLAAMLLRIGYVDAGIAGSLATTADVLRAGIGGVGLAENSILVSSCFLLVWPDKTFTFGDCAVNPAPDSAQLAQIAIDCAASHRALTGDEPRVAMLSFATKGSAEHASVDTVREALAMAQGRGAGLLIDGEMQFDAALVPGIADTKAPGSVVAGRANVYVFPDLNAGNIGYKIAQRLGGAQALGPILQGLAKPWLDLSRGCSSEEIVNTAIIASATPL